MMKMMTNSFLKKEYIAPSLKVVELKRQSALMACSTGGGELTPGICGPIGMTPFNDSHKPM
jgi:hypothetical protein